MNFFFKYLSNHIALWKIYEKNEFPRSIFRHRIPKDQWWLKLRPLLRILTKHKEKAYTPEGIFTGVDDFEDEDNI